MCKVCVCAKCVCVKCVNTQFCTYHFCHGFMPPHLKKICSHPQAPPPSSYHLLNTTFNHSADSTSLCFFFLCILISTSCSTSWNNLTLWSCQISAMTTTRMMRMSQENLKYPTSQESTSAQAITSHMNILRSCSTRFALNDFWATMFLNCWRRLSGGHE